MKGGEALRVVEAGEGSTREMLDKSHNYKAFKLQANDIPLLELRGSDEVLDILFF